MSLTLGERLRHAREERGLTLSEVSEQTRISSLYLESIENDDYRILPGGIFNKGFVKSYAKFVGLDEQDALIEYTKITARNEEDKAGDLKLYRPEVLTDDRSSQSIIPTAIIAVVILGLMTAGVLFLVNYFRNSDTQTTNPVPVDQLAANSIKEPANDEIFNQHNDVPDMAGLKVEFKALTEPVSLMATADGKTSSDVITPGNSKTFEPKEALKLSYSRSLASVVELTINGKKIGLPSLPLNPRRNAIEFEINRDNLAAIWNAGAITDEVPTASPVPPLPLGEIPVATPENSMTPSPVNTATPRPSPTIATVNRTVPSANSTARPTPAREPSETPAPPTPRPGTGDSPRQ